MGDRLMRRTRSISVKGCPVQLSRLFTAPGHLAKGATNGWCTLFAKPSALELAVSAQRGCLFLIHIKIPSWAAGGPISCLLPSKAVSQAIPTSRCRDPGQDSALARGCPAKIPGLQTHWLFPRCLPPNQSLQDTTGLHSPRTRDWGRGVTWGGG